MWRIISGVLVIAVGGLMAAIAVDADDPVLKTVTGIIGLFFIYAGFQGFRKPRRTGSSDRCDNDRPSSADDNDRDGDRDDRDDGDSGDSDSGGDDGGSDD